MKKKPLPKSSVTLESDMRTEYDFSGGVRGKHYKARLNGYTITIHKKDGTTLIKNIKREGGITLEPDVQKYFPNSRAVNHALRTLITLFPEKRRVAGSKDRSY
ncbi:hypothetical protein L0337_33820 [candidate division KSB1 bacterium]|nr:hypothetical protein [candidate division KSB1 bacterium]